MNPIRPFDTVLESWLEDGPVKAPSDLAQDIQDQLPGRRQDRRPFRSTRRLLMRTRITALAAAVVAVVAIAGAAYWLGGRDTVSPIGGDATPSAQATLTAEASPTASPEGTDGPTAAPTPVPTIGFCTQADLGVRIHDWQGATGHRIATVELRNTSSVSCSWPVLDQPQLVDGSGAILINGAAAAPGDLLTLAPGDRVSTLVQDGNYCRQNPVAPVTVAFVLPGGSGRVIADPVSATDLDGVPPCNGSAGSAGDIEMHPWSR